MTRTLLIVTCLGLGAACGRGGPGTPLIPHLPGEGDGTGGDKPAADQDPWKGRSDLIPAPTRVPAAAVTLPPIQRFTLANGLRVVVIERHDLPAVSMQLAVRAGRSLAPRDKIGVEQVTAALLDQGTRTRTGDAIRAELDRVGAGMAAQSSFESTLVSCAVVRSHLDTCLGLMPDVVVNPTFAEGAFTAARDQLRVTAVRRTQDPAQLAALHFQNLLWGEKHVRGWPMSASSVDAITRADVVGWHARWYKPNNAVLAVAGDVDPAALRGQLEAAFRGWKSGKVPAAPEYRAPTLAGPVARLIDWPGLPQAHIRIGHVGISHLDPDFDATVVFSDVLSARLRDRMKHEPGNGAAATAGFDHNLDAGVYVVSAVARPADAMAAVRAALQEMGNITEHGPTQAEVDATVMQTLGAYASRLETVADLANELLVDELHGVDDAAVRGYPVRIAAVTPAMAREAAGRVLEPEAPALVIVGDAATIAPQLEAQGIVFETISASEPVAGYERDPQPADPVKAAIEGRKILDRALAAKGGAARLRAIKSQVIEGTATGSLGGSKFTAQVKRSYVAPDKVRRDLTRTEGKEKVVSTIVLAGTTAWAHEIHGKEDKAGDLPAPYVAAIEAQLWRDPDLVLLRHLDKRVKVAALPPRTVQGASCHVVVITRPDGVSATLYLDQKTLLMRQMTYRSESSRAVESYGEYQPVKGIQVPFRRLTSDGMTVFDLDLKKVEFDVAVAPAEFEKPQK